MPESYFIILRYVDGGSYPLKASLIASVLRLNHAKTSKAL